MSEWQQKVFWSQVDVASDDDGFNIMLDGRTVKTPEKSVLQVPTQQLAREIAVEWRRQVETIDPKTLPITKLASAAIDKVAVQSAPMTEMLAEYGTTDLLCYRATSPVGLADRQEHIWQPLLDWFSDTYNIQLEVGSGVMPIRQPTEVLGACGSILKRYSHFELAAIYDLITLSGSFVIGLAAADKKISVPDAWAASRIDEDWQIEEWGEDDEATALSVSRKEAFERAAFVLTLLE